jgi:hypothetical protein
MMGEGQGFAILARPDATDQGPIQSILQIGRDAHRQRRGTRRPPTILAAAVIVTDFTAFDTPPGKKEARRGVSADFHHRGRSGAGTEFRSDATPDQLVVNEKEYDRTEHGHQQTVHIESGDA